MPKLTEVQQSERERVEAIRSAWHARVGHVCPRYETARTYAPHYDGLSDPSLQEGIGCPLCYPPNGRVSDDGQTKPYPGSRAQQPQESRP